MVPSGRKTRAIVSVLVVAKAESRGMSVATINSIAVFLLIDEMVS